MRLRPIALIVGLTLMAPPPALADDDGGSICSSLRAIGAFVEFGAPRFGSDGDEIAGVAGVLGYSFSRIPVRAEVEVTQPLDSDARESATQAPDYVTNLTSMSALASAILEWRNEFGLTPYAGVTAGWARTSTDTRHLYLSDPAAAEGDEGTDGFAYGGVLGLDWGVSENWSAGVAYRYLNLGGGEAGNIDAADSISTDDDISHDVLLSILYRF